MLLSGSVSGLSNIFRRRNGGNPPVELEIRSVRPGELSTAIGILLGQHGRGADDATVRDFVQFTRERHVPLDAIQVASVASGSQLHAACLAVISPGRTALLMTSPTDFSRAAPAGVVACVKKVADALSVDQVHLVQILLDTATSPAAAGLRQAGFDDLATLIYLQRTLRTTPTDPPVPPGCRLIHYSPENHAHFARAILASYEQSLDCALLHGRRDIEDVILGHKASGATDPSLWSCIVRESDGAELGVLLLASVPVHAMMELVYVGLSPQARGSGLGDYLLRVALAKTAHQGMRVLTLAVDAVNTPAIRLYHRHGLAEVQRRHAMIKDLRSLSPLTQNHT